MYDLLNNAVSDLAAINDASIEYTDEGKAWAAKYGLDTSVYSNLSHIASFFRAAKAIGKDDKYVSDRFLLRSCPGNLSPDSYFIYLFEQFGVREVIATPEANGYAIASLMAKGYKASSITLELTGSWASSRDAVSYRQGILLTKE